MGSFFIILGPTPSLSHLHSSSPFFLQALVSQDLEPWTGEGLDTSLGWGGPLPLETGSLPFRRRARQMHSPQEDFLPPPFPVAEARQGAGSETRG